MRTLLILLFSTVAAWAQPVFPPAFWAPAKAAAGGSCVSNEVFGTSANTSGNFGDTSSHYSEVSSNAPTSNYTICQIDFRILRVGSGTAPNFWAIITTNSPTGLPGTNTTPGGAVSSNVHVSADVGTSEQWVSFTFSPGFPVTSGTTYWVGCQTTNVDAANFYTVRGGASSSGACYQSANPTPPYSWAQTTSRKWYTIFYNQ